MPSELKVIDLVYFCNRDCNTPQQVIYRHQPSLGFVKYIRNLVNICMVKHCNYEGVNTIDNVTYAFFKRPNNFFQIPFKTHRYIKSLHPDIVIVNGLIFPLQVIALRLYLRKKCKIIAQHHGELPYEGIKKLFQKLADKCLTAYFFTAKENAKEWVAKGVVRDINKCHEVLEASTFIEKTDKILARKVLNFKGNHNFLWVGRLITIKEPFTVLKAFQKYTIINPSARLFMIYQADTLLQEVTSFIVINELQHFITLVGFVPHRDLPSWYTAADYFISGSVKEGSGYALLEAMACGCIPVVTNIPTFRKLTDNGKFGFLFQLGDPEDLNRVLCELDQINSAALSLKIENYFKTQLSFKKIAEDISRICILLHSK